MWGLVCEDEAQLREHALEQLRAAGGKDFRFPECEEAGDRTNTVRVTVGRGGAVRDVHVRVDWRREIGGHGIGPALLEAYENANLAMLNSVALASLAEQERRGTELVRAGSSEYLTFMPEADIAQIWQMLSDVDDLMHRTDQLARAATGEDTRTVNGPQGLLTARCSGAAITGISADPRRIESAEADQLRREALELLQICQGYF